ncbi:TPA: hypothetical protein ACI0TA_001999, partial [Streptococcus agalactiae]
MNKIHLIYRIIKAVLPKKKRKEYDTMNLTKLKRKEMRTYSDKNELKEEVLKSYKKYIAEFNDIPEKLKDLR